MKTIKKNMCLIAICLLGMQGLFAQTITYSFANAMMTDGSGNTGTTHYEADIMIATDTDFKLGLGQFYIDYNTQAFGSSIFGATLTFIHPSGDNASQYILDERFVSAVNVYGTVLANNTTSKLSIAWTQVLGSAQISTNVTTESPKLLAHLKIQFSDNTKDPMIAFDSVLSQDLTFTASAAVPGAGTQLTNDSYDSSGAVVPNTWSSGTPGDWNTGGNWAMGVPTTSSDITLPANIVVTASSAVDVNTLTIPTNGALNSASTVNNQGAVTIQSDATNSGVLITTGLTTNTVSYERGGFLGRDPGNANNDTNLRWSIVAAPVAGQTIKSFVENSANAIAQNVAGTIWAVGYYDDSRATNFKWVYYTVADLMGGGTHENTTFELGRSYAIARTAAGSVTFTGTLQTANLDKTVTASEWNAIGNPYTAFIPANGNGGTNNFIKDNETSLDVLSTGVYVWDNAQSRYVARSLGDTEQTSLTPGQGFFVKTRSAISSLSFNQNHRITQPATGNRVFGKTEATPNIQLKATLNNLTIDTNIRYFDEATLGLDPGYDLQDFGSESFDLYTKLLEGYQDKKFTIQSLPKNNYNSMIIPVGVRATKGASVNINAAITNLPDGIDVYLEDKTSNVFTKLNQNSKGYTITFSEAVDGTGRFYLHTTSSVLNTENHLLLGVSIFTSGKNELRIKGVNNEKVNIQMYNILGTKVLHQNFTGTGNNTIKLPKLAAGVYVINLKTASGTLNQKIIIE